VPGQFAEFCVSMLDRYAGHLPERGRTAEVAEGLRVAAIP
jgi:hypothetical protein